MKYSLEQFGLARKLAKQNGQSDEKTEQMIAYMEARGIKDVEFFDCSGLGVSYLLSVGAIGYDMTADGFYDKCTTIEKEDVREGDMTFLINSSGKATHIGYMVDKKTVVHALNQSRGVIEENMDKRQWKFGRPEFCLEYDLEIDISKLQKGDKITTTKDYRGYNSADAAKKGGSSKLTYPVGEYYVYKVYNGAVNISKKKGIAGAWVVL